MSKITLNNVGSLIDSTSAQATINANNAIIQTAFDNTLSRDGTSPNTMSNVLDMNSNQIINLPSPATGNSPLRLQDAATLNGAGTISTVPTGGTTGQFLSKTSNVDYAMQWSNAGAGTVTSIGLSAPADFTVTSSPVTTAGTIALSLTNIPTGTNGFVRKTSPTIDTPTLNSPVLVTPDLGTPTAGVATNLTGTASSLTAGHVTTNANLTGPITSAGNTTSVAAQTGTGSTFVMDTSPTLVTPTIGAATATSVNKVAITAPAAGSTLTIANGATLTASATATVSGTNTGDQTITLTSDVTGSGTGSFATTIANNAVTNAKLNVAPAYTLKANNTGSSGNVTDMDITALTLKASPAAADIVLIQDVTASNAFKKVTVSSLSSAGSVSSIAGNTGAFTLAYPISNSTNDIRYVGPTNCGRLTYSSSTALAFLPYNGDTIRIAGTIYQIPAAGIAGLGNPTSVFLNGVAAQTLAINTTYYIYAFNNGGTITADFSATGHSMSSTGGNIGTEIKTGDNTRTLIGMVRTGGTVLYNADMTTLSWFNRADKLTYITQSSAVAYTTTAQNFLTWADEAVTIGVVGLVSNSIVGQTVKIQHQIDGSNVQPLNQQGAAPGGTQQFPWNSTSMYQGAEGYHTFTAVLSNGGGSGTVSISADSYTKIRG